MPCHVIFIGKVLDDSNQKVEASTLARDIVTPKYESRPKKHLSPASKSSQFQWLLRFQEKLVKEKGLSRSRLQSKIDVHTCDVTPNPVKHCQDKRPKCTKNLLTNFQNLEANSCFNRSSAPSAGRKSSQMFQGLEASPCLYGTPFPRFYQVSILNIIP